MKTLEHPVDICRSLAWTRVLLHFPDNFIFLPCLGSFQFFVFLMTLMQDEISLDNHISFFLSVPLPEFWPFLGSTFEDLLLWCRFFLRKPFLHHLVSNHHCQRSMVMTWCIPEFIDGQVKISKAGLAKQICDLRVCQFLPKFWICHSMVASARHKANCRFRTTVKSDDNFWITVMTVSLRNRNCSLVTVIFRHVLSNQWWQMFHENGTTTGICCPFLKQGSQLNNMLVKVQVVGLGPKEFPVWPCHPVVHQCQGKDIHCNRITLRIIENTFQLLVPVSHVDGKELNYMLSVEAASKRLLNRLPLKLVTSDVWLLMEQ